MTSSPASTDRLLALILKDQPLSDALPHYGYGTAGFRFQASIMDGLMVRVGLLGVLLLLETPTVVNNEDMGIMITASHNDETYNGVKLARPDGSMLTPSQEAFLTSWVNENDETKWITMLETKCKELQTNEEAAILSKRTLHLGWDTRTHSPHLSILCSQGAKACVDALQINANVEVQDHGILTTPMLHHIVLHSNPQYLPSYITPKPSRDGYIQTFAEAYVSLMRLGASSNTSATAEAITRLHIDGACGVGHQAVQELTLAIQDLLEEDQMTSSATTLMLAHNGPGDGPLNLDCGSEHVQKQLLPPIWYDGTPTTSLEYCCALDGDADRIVFFGQDSAAAAAAPTVEGDGDVETPKGKLTNLLDGDKIAILIAHVLNQKLSEVGNDVPSMGIVQTAYANGASTKYVEVTLSLPVKIAKTGVKHLHHAAVESFDIGIYFEANGHGTVVFSKAYETFALQQQQNNNPFFVKLHQLINPAVGDALCDMLLVDYLLKSALGGWTLQQWNGMYHDLPSRMLKVKVQDRSIIICNENETECTTPNSVQPSLQQVMTTVKQGRTFIRPSGTEDVVRVYAEAATREEADKLANLAAQIVHDNCQGVGNRPEV